MNKKYDKAKLIQGLYDQFTGCTTTEDTKEMQEVLEIFLRYTEEKYHELYEVDQKYKLRNI